jgi:hypothetical protein
LSGAAASGRGVLVRDLWDDQQQRITFTHCKKTLQ